MAVAPTGNIFKGFELDNESSKDYGVYITGEAVYNAPERDVEMISIPGRSGAFALDRGRFENIEVTYPAGIFADNETDFAEAISEFRNYLCSRRGYCRLMDDYNPNEYRMAIYKSGLEVSPAQLKAGEFEIVFDCKPQRWLTSGEEAVTIGEWGETETASSDIVSVENPNGVLAVKSLEVDLEPIQSGSGTPSPTNVRPITGHTSVDVIVSPTTTASDGTTYTTALGRTVYGGTLDVVSGVLTVTKAIADLGSLTWSSLSTSVSGKSRFNAVLTAKDSDTTRGVTSICEQYIAVRQAGTFDAIEGYTINSNTIYMYAEQYSTSTAAQFKSALNGVHLCYELVTPTTVQLTAEEVELLVGLNQVWANSGDVTVEYGTAPNVLINPTLFESSPLLAVTGYGNIGINGATITIEDVDAGMIPVTEASSSSGTPDSQATYTVTIPLDDSNINGPDSIYVSGVECIVEREIDPGYSGLSASVTSVTDATGTCNATGEVMRARLGDGSFISAGTGSNIIGTVNYSVSYTYNGSRSSNSFTITIIATRVSGGIEVEVTAGGIEPLTVARSITISVPVIYAYSSNSALGNPTYIDLDLGAAWNADSGTAVSLNNAVQLPAKLPTLKVGANLISFDSNITDLKVVPRWWKI